MTAEPLGCTCDFVPAASAGFGVRFLCEFLATITNDSSPVEREWSTADVTAFKQSPPYGAVYYPTDCRFCIWTSRIKVTSCALRGSLLPITPVLGRTEPADIYAAI
jgi:hypothetical protein